MKNQKNDSYFKALARQRTIDEITRASRYPDSPLHGIQISHKGQRELHGSGTGWLWIVALLIVIVVVAFVLALSVTGVTMP